MAMKMAVAISEVILIAGAGWSIGSFLKEFGKQNSAEDKAYLNGVLPKVMEVRQELSILQNKIYGKTDLLSIPSNITSLIIPTVTIGAIAYGIMWFKDISLSNFLFPTNRSITNTTEGIKKKLDQISTALEVVILRGELYNRNQQINNLNQQIEGLETILLARKTDSRGEIGVSEDNVRRKRRDTFHRGSMLS